MGQKEMAEQERKYGIMFQILNIYQIFRAIHQSQSLPSHFCDNHQDFDVGFRAILVSPHVPDLVLLLDGSSQNVDEAVFLPFFFLF